jgi:hypothetical protein
MMRHTFYRIKDILLGSVYIRSALASVTRQTTALYLKSREIT